LAKVILRCFTTRMKMERAFMWLCFTRIVNVHNFEIAL